MPNALAVLVITLLVLILLTGVAWWVLLLVNIVRAAFGRPRRR